MESPMNRNYIIFSLFAGLIGSFAAAHALTTLKVADGVSYTGKRLASYGYTHKRIALAEFAAIRTWKREAEENDPGFGNWHLSHKRTMKCRLFKSSAHFQCIVSATPCKFDRS
jgi:hypothetical protein